VNRWLVVVAASIALTGCVNISQKIPEPFGTRPATDVLHDGLILATVKAKLTQEDPDSATTLGVSVRDGVVQLKGTVRDAAHRSHDVASARAVSGVRVVVDELRVDPHGPRPGLELSEAALEARIITACTAQVGFQPHVGVHVDHGVVTLSGTVENAKIRQTIATTARGTTGVRKVVDHIRIGKP
jgi:hyperosmotically inducible protein